MSLEEDRDRTARAPSAWLADRMIEGKSLKGAEVGEKDASRGRAEARRYSRARFEDGTEFVHVDVDQKKFDGKTPEEQAKIAQKTIQERFQGKVIGEGEKTVFVNGKGGREYAHPARHIFGEEHEAKMRTSPELDTLMKTSRKAEGANDDGRHENAKGGWVYYDALFEVGGRYYSGRVSAQVNEKGQRLFNDVTKIKRESGSGLTKLHGNPIKEEPANQAAETAEDGHAALTGKRSRTVLHSTAPGKGSSDGADYSTGGKAAQGGAQIRPSIGGRKGAAALGIGKAADAERMEKDGASREDIWRKTGWWRGRDGKWRVELPDVKPEAWHGDPEERHFTGGGDDFYRYRLTEMVRDNGLFDAYPALKKIGVEFHKNMPANVGGNFNEATLTITLPQTSQVITDYAKYGLAGGKAAYPNVLGMKTLVHEIQHAIQLFEGLAKGGSPTEPVRPYALDGNTGHALTVFSEAVGMDPTNERHLAIIANWAQKIASDHRGEEVPKRLIERFEAAAKEAGRTPQEFRDEIVRFYDSKTESPFGQYFKLEGEVEARNVQKRLAMTPEKRAATPPWATEDVPEDRQIVRYSRKLKEAKEELKGKTDMSKPENAKAFRKYLASIPAKEMPDRLTDGRPKAALEWFMKNLAGKTFTFDIPGIGKREFRVNAGHMFRLVCDTPKETGKNGERTRKGFVKKAKDAEDARRMIANGEVAASDIAGWNESRARSLPLIPEVLQSYDAVFREKARPGFLVLLKKFVTKSGHVNTVIMRLNEDGETLGPMSAHMKGITDRWLKGQDLTVTEDGEVFTRTDNSATDQADFGDNAESNSPKNGHRVSQTGEEVKGGVEQSQQIRPSIGGRKGAAALGIGKAADAERMEKDGASREEIWRRTGWWRSRDGQWRVELPPIAIDEQKLKQLDTNRDNYNFRKRKAQPEYHAPLEDLIADKQLVAKLNAAYGTLPHISVVDDVGWALGKYRPETNSIDIHRHLTAAEMRSVLEHELQHFIQHKEGFPGGGDNTGGEYRNLTGEVEARNVQKRLAMTPEKRAATPPWATEDVPEDRQIVRYSRKLIGTDKGVYTARIDTKNPKTKDGFNTVIFRRSPSETAAEVDRAPTVKAVAAALPKGLTLGDKSTKYTPEQKTLVRKFVVERAKSQRGKIENQDFGEIIIGRDFVNEVQRHALSTARETAAVSSAREIAANMKHFAAAPNEEIKKGRNKYIEYGLARFEFDGATYLVMGEVGVRRDATPYYDQRVVAKIKADTSPLILHDGMETESALDEVYDNRFRILMQAAGEELAAANGGRGATRPTEGGHRVSQTGEEVKGGVEQCRVDFKTGKFVEIKTGMVFTHSGTSFRSFSPSDCC